MHQANHILDDHQLFRSRFSIQFSSLSLSLLKKSVNEDEIQSGAFQKCK